MNVNVHYSYFNGFANANIFSCDGYFLFNVKPSLRGGMNDVRERTVAALNERYGEGGWNAVVHNHH